MQFDFQIQKFFNNATNFVILFCVFAFTAFIVISLNPETELKQSSVAGVSTLKRDVEIDILYKDENHTLEVENDNHIKIIPRRSEKGVVSNDFLKITNKSQIWQDFVIFPMVKGNVQDFIEIRLLENNETKYLLKKGNHSQSINISVAPNSETNLLLEIETFRQLAFPYEISLNIQ